MSKYSICSKVGEIFVELGFLLVLLTMSIDLDHSDWRWSVIGFCASAAVIGLGFALLFLQKVEGILIASIIMLLAFIYSIFKRPAKIFRVCYKIKNRYATYKDAFVDCVDMYENFVESEMSNIH